MTWACIHKQAREIARRKTTKARQRQAALYFEMVREALNAVPVRAVQSDTGTNMDAGTSGALPGPLVAEPAARVSA